MIALRQETHPPQRSSGPLPDGGRISFAEQERLKKLELARKLDPNTTHPWLVVTGDILFWDDDFGVVAMGLTYDPNEPKEDSKAGLLLLAVNPDSSKATSIHITDELSGGERVRLANLVNEVISKLPPQTRHAIIELIITQVTALKAWRLTEGGEILPTNQLLELFTSGLLQLG